MADGQAEHLQQGAFIALRRGGMGSGEGLEVAVERTDGGFPDGHVPDGGQDPVVQVVGVVLDGLSFDPVLDEDLVVPGVGELFHGRVCGDIAAGVAGCRPEEVEVFVLAAQRVAQHLVGTSEGAALLIGETVGAPGEGDAGFEYL